jgi:hypothetical protein
VSIFDLRVRSQMLPPVIGVGHGLKGLALELRRVLQFQEGLLYPFQDGFGIQMPILPPLLVRELQPLVGPSLNAVELGDVLQDRSHLALVGDHRLEYVRAEMTQTFKMAQERHIGECTRIPTSPVSLDITGPFQGREIEHLSLAPLGGELEVHRLLVRGHQAPEVGVVRATSALRIDHFGDCFIEVQVAAAQDLVKDLLGDRDQQVRRIVNDADQGLARDIDAMAQPDSFLTIKGKVIRVLRRIADYAGRHPKGPVAPPEAPGR